MKIKKTFEASNPKVKNLSFLTVNASPSFLTLVTPVTEADWRLASVFSFGLRLGDGAEAELLFRLAAGL